MENFVALSTPDNGNFFIPSNLSSVTPLKVVSLADNNCSDTSDENCNGAYDFKLPFSASSAIIILGLLGLLFLVGLFFIFIWCHDKNREDSRASRRTDASNNARVAAIEGLERTVIESFPLFSYNLVKGLNAQAKGSECAVCLSDFEDEETVRLLPKCSHAFHQECIDTWLCSHTTCPVCRTSLLPAEESNPRATDFGVIEPQTQPDQVAIVIDNVSTEYISNAEAKNGIPETSHDSMRISLVTVQK